MNNSVPNRSKARFLLPALAAVLFCAALSAAERTSQPVNPQALATYRGVGMVVDQMVGPGPTPGSQRLYLSYAYSTGLEVVSLDVATGKFDVFKSPVASEVTARTLETGPDGKIYLGTAPHAHILCLDPARGTLVDMGRPLSSEQYIWQLRLGNDRKLYGCTYPSARLFRFDPMTQTVEDLGSLDPEEKYAEFLAAGNDGFVYVGVGSVHGKLLGYRIQTGVLKPVVLAGTKGPGIPVVYKASDGKCYARFGGRSFRLNGWTAQATTESIPGGEGRTVLNDKSYLQVEDNVLTRNDAGKTSRLRFDYEGKEAELFRLALGPDRMLYASTSMPSYLLRIDPQTGEMTKLGKLGGGEAYSLLAHEGKLLIASYSNDAPLMVYDPQRPWVGKDAVSKREAANPAPVPTGDIENSWRPGAMVEGPGGLIYVGGMPGYGKRSGPFCAWNVAKQDVACFPPPVSEESVASLTRAGEWLVGGTDLAGGGGSTPTRTDATLFVWDAQARKCVFQIKPVPGAKRISGLAAVSDETIYGFAEKDSGPAIFVFDLPKRAVTKTGDVSLNWLIQGGLAMGSDGLLWGLSKVEIFTIDPATDAVVVRHRINPGALVRGFALEGPWLYYAVGPTLYRYHIGLR